MMERLNSNGGEESGRGVNEGYKSSTLSSIRPIVGSCFQYLGYFNESWNINKTVLAGKTTEPSIWSAPFYLTRNKHAYH